jgi:hypothetical protein
MRFPWTLGVVLCGGVMAVEDWEAILGDGLPDPDYARACPDYKKYSTYAQ